ncbi:cupin domain-containing protein [Pleurocapsales cyanobacterium LEGE 10410]|nr:cupin domain-containing protein [Pleurocapsales cyanobacterium LEGE 10410]
MKIFKIPMLLDRLPLIDLNQANSKDSADVRSSFIDLGEFDRGSVSLIKYAGETPWERHVDGNEFFYLLEGELRVTLLREDLQEFVLTKGDTCIVPRNVWHRSKADSQVTLLALIASEHGAVSYAEDPRIAI